jgi:transposase
VPAVSPLSVQPASAQTEISIAPRLSAFVQRSFRSRSAPRKLVARFRRVALLSGPGRRRHWSAEEKAQIVAETLVPGVRKLDMARRRQLHPQQLFGWRHQARKAAGSQLMSLTSDAGPALVSIVTESSRSVTTAGAAKRASSVEIEPAGAVRSRIGLRQPTWPKRTTSRSPCITSG